VTPAPCRGHDELGPEPADRDPERLSALAELVEGISLGRLGQSATSSVVRREKTSGQARRRCNAMELVLPIRLVYSVFRRHACGASRARAPAHALLGDLAAVDDHGEDVSDNEDPTHQARAIQMSVPTGCCANRSRIVLTMDVTAGFRRRRAPDRACGGGHECRADERQEDERVGERARTVHGLRGETGGSQRSTSTPG